MVTVTNPDGVQSAVFISAVQGWSPPATTAPPATKAPPATAPPATAPPVRTPALTQQQGSAVAAANQYLSTMAFSQQGLIDQLDSPYGGGYSANDATVAVDSLTVDWNAEAVQAAKEYLQTQPFSCSDLIQQLDSVRWRVHGRSGYVWSDAGRRLLGPQRYA